MESLAKRFAHSATFTATARVSSPDETDRFIAKASLEPLRGLLPAGVNPEDHPDLLYIGSNGAVAGLCNRNGDAVSAQTAVAIHRSAAVKYVSVDHDRQNVVGVVLYPGLTRFGSNEPITDEQALTLNEPFNMAFAGVLWKVIDGKLCKYIRMADGTLDDDAVSMSWEILFNSFDIGVGAKNLWDCKVVKAGDPQYDDLVPRLRAKGGAGKSPSGEDIFRIITGDAIILGYSIVANPAAEVRGVLPIVEAVMTSSAPVAEAPCSASVDTPPATPATPPAPASSEPTQAAPEAAAEAAASATTSEKIITPSETRVTPITAIMKIESLDQLKTAWPELRKSEESYASIEGFVAALQKANEQHLADLSSQKDLAANLEQSKAEAEKRATELQQSLAQVQKQVEDLRNAALAAEQDRKFQERMASFDETYDLDDEDRQLLASDIKGLDDAAFAAYQKKCEKLMSGKKKGAKPAMAAASTTTVTVTPATVTAAFASVTETSGQSIVPPGQTPVDTNLEGEMESAFGGTFRVNGKTVSERKAEKAAKAPKE